MGKAKSTRIQLTGTIVGNIWMPCAECWKDVKLDRENDFRYSDGSLPTARQMALEATADGDFQSCNLTKDSYFTFERSYRTAAGELIVRRRHMSVSAFPSIADMVDARESWELMSDDAEDAA